jgi:hypothetical protein
MEQQEIVVYKGQITKLENQAIEVTIASPEDNAKATELKGALKEKAKTLKARKEEITKPLNAALTSARALFAPLEDQIEAADTIIGRKLRAYKQKVEAEARAEAEKIAAKVEAERRKIEEQLAARKITESKAEQKLDQSLQKAEQKLESIPTIQKTTHTAYGQVQFRKIKKVRIVDAAALPREYLIPDEVLIRRDALAGKEIPGVEVYIEESV